MDHRASRPYPDCGSADVTRSRRRYGRPFLEQAEILEKVFQEQRKKQSQVTKDLAQPIDMMFV